MDYLKFVILLVLSVLPVKSAPRSSERILGGAVTSVANWPFASSLLYSWNMATYSQSCGGTIITTTAILSAAHCFYGDSAGRWRARVGSTNANSGGVVHLLRAIVINMSYNVNTQDGDIAVLRTVKSIAYNTNAQPARISAASYSLGDNEMVWAIGWGTVAYGGLSSEQLREVQIWTVNLTVCRAQYASHGLLITNNMICSGYFNVGGRDQCQGDSGGPLIHNNVVVGVCSWGNECGLAQYPGVNTRVSNYVSWINSAVA